MPYFGARMGFLIAKRAADSLRTEPPSTEPQRTPTAVGFELVELFALIRKCRGQTVDKDALEVLDLAASECARLLDNVSSDFAEVRVPTFLEYRRKIGN